MLKMAKEIKIPKVGDKVVYLGFAGHIKQMLPGDSDLNEEPRCIISLGAPMSDGAVTIIAPTLDSVEVVKVKEKEKTAAKVEVS
jgi:hypothetical protein